MLKRNNFRGYDNSKDKFVTKTKHLEMNRN